jgi:hypothetical protein
VALVPEPEEERKTTGLPTPREDIEALETNLGKAREHLAGATSELGYQLDVVKVTRPYWESVSPASGMPVASGAVVLHTWREQSEALARESERVARQITNMSGTASYVAANTGTLSQIYPVSPPIDIGAIQRITVQRSEQDFVEKGLMKIDNHLARTYATIWQYIRYPAFDPMRGPLFLMRQVFDHFLDKLAPDNEVQSQPSFQPDAQLKKKNGKGITRNHRIEYIANTKVRHLEVRSSLKSSSKNFHDIYDGLNEAHKRAALNEDAARQAVYAGSTLLANWLRALEYK